MKHLNNMQVYDNITAENITATNDIFIGALSLSGAIGNKADLSILQDSSEPTGFLDWTATLSFDDATRTFTITGNHSFYNNAVKVSKGTTSIQIPNLVGQHYIYYNASSVLTTSLLFPSTSTVLTALVYWNGSKGLLSDERHGCVMDWATHSYLHQTIGTRYQSGLAGTFTNNTFGIAQGIIWDEDIKHDISAQTTAAVLFKNGSAAWDWNANQTKYYHDNGANVYYNDGNNLAVAANNQYVAYWCFATNSVINPIVFVAGQRIDGVLANARANNTYESLSFGELPFKEMKILYRVILAGNRTYVETQDLRSLSNLPSGTYVATDHNTLSNIEGLGTLHVSEAQTDNWDLGYDHTGNASPHVPVVQAWEPGRLLRAHTSMNGGYWESLSTILRLGGNAVSQIVDTDLLPFLEQESEVVNRITWANVKTAIGAEPSFSKNTAFNKNYGTTATDVKINGTQAVGTIDAIARIDHVHPIDTSRAATNQTMHIGTTSVAINRASATLNLAGIGTLDSAAITTTQNMSDHGTAFTGPHIALKAGNTVDNTGFVGITYAGSPSANYGWSAGVVHTTNGQSNFIFKHHDNSIAGTERVKFNLGGGIDIAGNVGINFSTHGGGWNMTDSTWIRTVGSKSIYQNTGTLRTDGTLQVGDSGATLSVVGAGNLAYRTNVLFANTTGNVGIGTVTPNNKLDVVGDIRIHQSNNLKFGGVGASDSKVHMQYNATTKSLDFNFV